MRIAKDAVVAIDYVLTADDGQVIDSSEGRSPLVYLHGTGGMIPGLERELTGKQAGDALQVSVEPEDAYGDWREALRQDIPRGQFEGMEKLELGMQFRVESNQGPLVVTVVEISPDFVTVDGNHPLAGMTLHFSVNVRDVRAATEEELAHGHVHGPGGHHHG